MVIKGAWPFPWADGLITGAAKVAYILQDNGRKGRDDLLLAAGNFVGVFIYNRIPII